MPEDVSHIVNKFKDDSLEKIDQAFVTLKIEHATRSRSPQPSREALKAFLRWRQGAINKVSFKFPRHMVFVHKGVGRGVPASEAGSSRTTRVPKPWFNDPLTETTEELADGLAAHFADASVDRIFIK